VFLKEATEGSTLNLPERTCQPLLRAIEADLIATVIKAAQIIYGEA